MDRLYVIVCACGKFPGDRGYYFWIGMIGGEGPSPGTNTTLVLDPLATTRASYEISADGRGDETLSKHDAASKPARRMKGSRIAAPDDWKGKSGSENVQRAWRCVASSAKDVKMRQDNAERVPGGSRVAGKGSFCRRPRLHFPNDQSLASGSRMLHRDDKPQDFIRDG